MYSITQAWQVIHLYSIILILVYQVCLPQTTSSILHADSMTNVLVYVEWKYQQSLQQCPTCGGELT